MERKKRTGIILERVRELAERYGERDPSIIYAHMLEKNVWFWEKEVRREPNEYMLLGELIHQALPRVLEPAPMVCRRVYLPPGYHNIDKRVWERYVRYDQDRRRFYVKLCGSADGMWNDHPVELKTTRRRNGDIKEEWLLRSRIYAWLYSKPTILVVLNIIDGIEDDTKVGGFTDKEIQELILRWLRGEFPHRTNALFAARGKGNAWGWRRVGEGAHRRG